MDKGKIYYPGEVLTAETANWLNNALLGNHFENTENYIGYVKYDIEATSQSDIPPFGVCIPVSEGVVKLYEGENYPYMLATDENGAVAGGSARLSLCTEPTPIWYDPSAGVVDVNLAFSRINPQYDWGPAIGSAMCKKGNPPFHILGVYDNRGPNATVLAVQRFKSFECAKTIYFTMNGGDADYVLPTSDLIPGTYEITVDGVGEATDLTIANDYSKTALAATLKVNDLTIDAGFGQNVFVVNYQNLFKVSAPASFTLFTLWSLKDTDEVKLHLQPDLYSSIKVQCTVSLRRVEIYDI